MTDVSNGGTEPVGDLTHYMQATSRLSRENGVLKKLILEHFITEESLLPHERKVDRLRYLMNLAEGEVVRDDL